MSARDHVIAEIVRAAEKGLGVDKLIKLEDDARDALYLAEAVHILYSRGLVEAEQDGNARRERELEELAKAVGQAIRNSNNTRHMLDALGQLLRDHGVPFVPPEWVFTTEGVINTGE